MSEMLTLLLAWRLAVKFGEDQAAAIRKCAANLAPQTEDEKVKELLLLLKQNNVSDFKILESVKSVYINMKYSNLI